MTAAWSEAYVRNRQAASRRSQAASAAARTGRTRATIIGAIAASRGGRCSFVQIMAVTGRSRATVQRHLAVLQEQGVVDRGGAVGDARVIVYWLTGKETP
jgi:DNA-binding MarR family transcriptional regulator